MGNTPNRRFRLTLIVGREVREPQARPADRPVRDQPEVDAPVPAAWPLPLLFPSTVTGYPP